jgi:hypothetical protein
MKRTSLIAISFGALLLSATAQAYTRPLLAPSGQLDEATKLTLARAMVGEADWHEPDHIAIAFVLAKRWPLYRNHHQEATFQQYIELYSSPLRRDLGARSAWLRSLTWGPIEGPHSQRWDRVRALVERFSEGRLKDPCPGAMHWGGAMDRPGAGMKPVSCGYTRNIFYSFRNPISGSPSKISGLTRKSAVLMAVNAVAARGGSGSARRRETDPAAP